MLREHRGKVVFIPIVVPDNIFVGIGHALGVISAILLIVAAASQQWFELSITVPADSVYDPVLTSTVRFGLRSMHITYCETYNQSITGNNVLDGCGFEDVFYMDCSASNDWCAAHGNTAISFAILILDAFLVLATCVVALIRLGLLPSGFMVSAWVALLSVATFRQENALFIPSTYLQSWIDYGTTEQRFLWAYFCATSSVFVLAAAVGLSTYGYVRAGREDAQREQREIAAAQQIPAEALESRPDNFAAKDMP